MQRSYPKIQRSCASIAQLEASAHRDRASPRRVARVPRPRAGAPYVSLPIPYRSLTVPLPRGEISAIAPLDRRDHSVRLRRAGMQPLGRSDFARRWPVLKPGPPQRHERRATPCAEPPSDDSFAVFPWFRSPRPSPVRVQTRTRHRARPRGRRRKASRPRRSESRRRPRPPRPRRRDPSAPRTSLPRLPHLPSPSRSRSRRQLSKTDFAS